MQQLLISWLLVGILVLPATQVGMIQALIGLPGIVLMLWGGAAADRMDTRMLLVRVYAVAWLFPVALFIMVQLDLLNIWSVGLFGLCMSTAISYSSPAQQAILNRVAGDDVQRGVTAATTMSFIVQIFGFMLAGQMETVGIDKVLLVQAASLILGAFAIRRIAALSTPPVQNRESTITVILDGLRVAINNRTILHTLIITFVSSIFNFGAFQTAIPFIVKRAYDGDAIGYAMVMIIFYGGATISNLIQLRIMPLARPGFWFLLMQASRVIVLLLVWIEPDWWLLLFVMFLWGLNMGVTSNLSRAVVQEASEPAYLARLLSVYNLGMIGAMPIGALFLGIYIDTFGEFNAMIPAMVVSIALCLYGFIFTRLGQYRSPYV
jgi:hypothetical protein